MFSAYNKSFLEIKVSQVQSAIIFYKYCSKFGDINSIYKNISHSKRREFGHLRQVAKFVVDLQVLVLGGLTVGSGSGGGSTRRQAQQFKDDQKLE